MRNHVKCDNPSNSTALPSARFFAIICDTMHNMLGDLMMED